jgi:hypothetical protein
MSRTLTLLFRRDPLRDHQTDNVAYEGYEVLWPDGKPVALGLDAFCKHGQRLLGLGKHLKGCQEKLVKMVCLPLTHREDDLNRIPGYRVRRFYLQRTGQIGRLHFMDGTPTVATFDPVHDDPRITYWIGLDDLSDGEVLWLDLAAVAVETAIPQSRARLRIFEA